MAKYIVIGLLLVFISKPQAQQWKALTIADNCDADVVRSMAVGVYDISVNKTFIAFIGENENIYVAWCDHNNGNKWSNNLKVADSPSELSAKYAYPQIVQTPDGTLHIFFAKHDTNLWQIKSLRPSDASEWKAPEELHITSNEPNYWKMQPAYPMPIVARNGHIYLFWRQEIIDNTRHMLYSISKDNGNTWEPAIAALTPVRDDNMNEIYLSQIISEPKREGKQELFHFVFILAGGKGHNDFHKDILHCTFSPLTNEFYSASGRNLGKNVDASELSNYCVVLNSGNPQPNYPGYTNYVGISDTGTPIVNSEYLWTGEKWKKLSKTGLGVADGIPFTTWRDGRFLAYGDRIEVYQSTNYGTSWSFYQKANLPKVNSGRSNRTILITPPNHPNAQLWSKENESEVSNCILSVAGQISDLKPFRIRLTTKTPTIGESQWATITAYVVDSLGAPVNSSNIPISFTCNSLGELSDNTSTINNGTATIRVKALVADGIITIKASSSVIKSDFTDIYIGEPHNFPPELEEESSDNFINQNSIYIYPNPLTNQSNIYFSLNNNAEIFYQIHNVLGNKIYESSEIFLTIGEQHLPLTQNLNQGIYSITLFANSETHLIKALSQTQN